MVSMVAANLSTTSNAIKTMTWRETTALNGLKGKSIGKLKRQTWSNHHFFPGVPAIICYCFLVDPVWEIANPIKIIKSPWIIKLPASIKAQMPLQTTRKTLLQAVPCCAMLCHAVPCCAMLCHAVPFLAATCSDHWLPQLASTGPTGPSTFPIAALEVARDRMYAKPAIVQRPNLQTLTTFWTSEETSEVKHDALDCPLPAKGRIPNTQNSQFQPQSFL